MAGEVSSARPKEEEQRKDEQHETDITALQGKNTLKEAGSAGDKRQAAEESISGRRDRQGVEGSRDDIRVYDKTHQNGDTKRSNEDMAASYEYRASSPLEYLDNVPRDPLQPSPVFRRNNTERNDYIEHMDAASWTVRGHLTPFNPETYTARQHRKKQGQELLNAKILRRKADEELMARRNRVNRLKFEEERTYKTISMAKAKVQDVVRLKAHNQLRNKEKEEARRNKAERLKEETQQKSLERARRIASIKATADHRQAAEERASKMKREIYLREREALHRKYKDRHLSQMRTLQLYESKLQGERQKHLERQEEIQRLEQEEAMLLERLKQAQDEKKKSFSALANAIRI
eukprot:749821-Hanusia_phi.AAC.13